MVVSPPMPEPIITPVRSRCSSVCGTQPESATACAAAAIPYRMKSSTLRRSWLHPVVGIERPAAAVPERDLAGVFRHHVGRIEPGDRTGPGLPVQQPRPGLLDPAGQRCDHSQSGNDNPAHSRSFPDTFLRAEYTRPRARNAGENHGRAVLPHPAAVRGSALLFRNFSAPNPVDRPPLKSHLPPLAQTPPSSQPETARPGGDLRLNRGPGLPIPPTPTAEKGKPPDEHRNPDPRRGHPARASGGHLRRAARTGGRGGAAGTGPRPGGRGNPPPHGRNRPARHRLGGAFRLARAGGVAGNQPGDAGRRQNKDVGPPAIPCATS